MAKTIWIARDKDGDLYLYSEKPKLDVYKEFHCSQDSEYIFNPNRHNDSSHVKIDSDWYPEVTFENSPKELIIKD